MSVPFTQYLLPNGRPRPIEIARPAEIETLAVRFLHDGGRYEIEILTTGEVSLSAVHLLEGEEQDVVIILSENGPDIPFKVDLLIRSSQEYIGRR